MDSTKIEKVSIFYHVLLVLGLDGADVVGRAQRDRVPAPVRLAVARMVFFLANGWRVGVGVVGGARGGGEDVLGGVLRDGVALAAVGAALVLLVGVAVLVEHGAATQLRQRCPATRNASVAS